MFWFSPPALTTKIRVENVLFGAYGTQNFLRVRARSSVRRRQRPIFGAITTFDAHQGILISWQPFVYTRIINEPPALLWTCLQWCERASEWRIKELRKRRGLERHEFMISPLLLGLVSAGCVKYWNALSRMLSTKLILLNHSWYSERAMKDILSLVKEFNFYTRTETISTPQRLWVENFKHNFECVSSFVVK